jgi:hypothetical protein
MLRLLKVPPKPHLPAGATDSARVFRASKRYLQLKLLNWGGGQVLTFIGLVAALVAINLVGTGKLDILTEVPHRAIILRVLGWFEVFGVIGFMVRGLWCDRLSGAATAIPGAGDS